MDRFRPTFIPATKAGTGAFNADKKFTQLVKRVFGSEDGRALLERMSAVTVDRPAEPFWPVESLDSMMSYLYRRGVIEGRNEIVQQLLFELQREG